MTTDVAQHAGVTRTDHAELSSQIRDAGLLERRTGYALVKFARTWALFGAARAAFVLIGPTWWQRTTASGPARPR